jgi:hypothetical protein
MPVTVQAQGTSILTLLPTDDRRLEIGGEFRGALSASDHLSTNDNFLEGWALDGRAGESVTIDLLSDDFDSHLYVVGPGLTETLSADDGGGGCNARLTFTFLENGTFRVVASSWGMRETGTYRLRVSTEPGDAPSYGCGEADPAALALLPTEGRTLRMGSQESGQLGASSPTIQDGRPAQGWVLEGRGGERLRIVMETDAFDAYLFMTGPGLGVLSDDDGAGDLNPQIEVTLPADGSYTVVASALSSGVSGSYTISVQAPPDLNTLPTGGRTIDIGQTVEGQLLFADPVVLDGRRAQAWELMGVAGQRLDIELTADDFDAYLYLVGPGIGEPMSDDDGGGGTNSRISVTLPESGTYRVLVSAFGSDSSGPFTLNVTPR